MAVHMATATHDDRAAVWEILAPMIAAGETYPLPRDMDRTNALAYRFSPSHEVFVAQVDGPVAGTYYLRPNHPARTWRTAGMSRGHGQPGAASVARCASIP